MVALCKNFGTQNCASCGKMKDLYTSGQGFVAGKHMDGFLIIAGILPFVFTGVAKYGVYSRNENREPRTFRASLTGYRKRAYAAQDNSFESFPFFACGVIVAHLWGEPSHFLWINSLAALHVVARCLYGWAYVTDRDLMRSLFWSIGFFAALTLYLV